MTGLHHLAFIDEDAFEVAAFERADFDVLDRSDLRDVLGGELGALAHRRRDPQADPLFVGVGFGFAAGRGGNGHKREGRGDDAAKGLHGCRHLKAHAIATS